MGRGIEWRRKRFEGRPARNGEALIRFGTAFAPTAAYACGLASATSQAREARAP